MTENKTCRMCDVELNTENWAPSAQKKNDYRCKECTNERVRLWREANPEKVKAQGTRNNRKRGARPFNENKECASYLGIHVAERVLSHVFKDVKRMPCGNPGYDFICNKGKKIDVKSACLSPSVANGTEYPHWAFHIRHNTTIDYFICIAFDNREDLNPLHAWLLPGGKFNHLVTAAIRPSTTPKWDEYRLDLSKVLACCDAMR